MKIVLLSLMAVMLVESQFPFSSYYHPRFFNPMYRDISYIGFPHQFVYNPNGVWFSQGNADPKEKSDFDFNEQAKGRTSTETESLDNKLSPRLFFFNNYDGSFAIQRPQLGFSRRTLFFSTTETKTVFTTTNCFASTLFPANAPQCANRKRDIEALLEQFNSQQHNAGAQDQLEVDASSVVQKVEPTALESFPNSPVEISQWQGEIISSKRDEDYGAEGLGLHRPKRLFARISASTFTEFRFTTSTLSRRIDARILRNLANCQIGGAAGQCQLQCIPPGYSAC